LSSPFFQYSIKILLPFFITIPGFGICSVIIVFSFSNSSDSFSICSSNSFSFANFLASFMLRPIKSGVSISSITSISS